MNRLRHIYFVITVIYMMIWLGEEWDQDFIEYVIRNP